MKILFTKQNYRHALNSNLIKNFPCGSEENEITSKLTKYVGLKLLGKEIETNEIHLYVESCACVLKEHLEKRDPNIYSDIPFHVWMEITFAVMFVFESAME